MGLARRRLALLHLVRRASVHGRRLTRLSFSRLGRWAVCFPALRRRLTRLSFSRLGRWAVCFPALRRRRPGLRLRTT
jgi:hypothetical protein